MRDDLPCLIRPSNHVGRRFDRQLDGAPMRCAIGPGAALPTDA
jgi:hypothetical protein